MNQDCIIITTKDLSHKPNARPLHIQATDIALEQLANIFGPVRIDDVTVWQMNSNKLVVRFDWEPMTQATPIVRCRYCGNRLLPVHDSVLDHEKRQHWDCYKAVQEA